MTNFILAGFLFLFSFFNHVLALTLETDHSNPKMAVYFSPNGDCIDSIIREIRGAHYSILIQSYDFSSHDIALALTEAHKRDVKIQIILDKNQKSDWNSQAESMSSSNIAVFIDQKHSVAHNEIIIIDGKTVITGSLSFSKAAEVNNAENLLILCDSELAARYTDNWQTHLNHSEKYLGRGISAVKPTQEQTQAGNEKMGRIEGFIMLDPEKYPRFSVSQVKIKVVKIVAEHALNTNSRFKAIAGPQRITVATFAVQKDGRFSIILPAGNYELVTEVQSKDFLFPEKDALKIEVVADQITNVQIPM
jgi:hypothetical protein